MASSPDVNALADDVLALIFDSQPLYATALGIRDRDRLLADHSVAAEAALLGRLDALAARADALDPSLDRDVLAEIVDQTRAMTQVRPVEFTVTAALNGPLSELLLVCRETALLEPAHAADYLERLRAIPEFLRTIADRHRAGTAAGRTGVDRLVRAAIEQAGQHAAGSGEDPLAVPSPPDGWDGAAAWREERDRVLADVVRPSVAAYRDAIAADVLPHARDLDHPGLCHLPDGERDYARLIAAHTTTRRTAAEIHQLGLDTIARLSEEFAEVGERALGLREPAEIFAALRDRPELRYTSAEEILAVARASVARAEEAAPRWFGRLPEQRCAVAPVPAGAAPHVPGAYYMPPAVDGSRRGTFFANTYDPASRLRHEAEATAFHEAVPGHHFQISLAQELTDLPLLRRFYPFTAFAEGWGLYCERLADEMGLYSDDVARLGMLSTDAWRAARLVVDTGLHAMGWSRERAVAYCLEHTPNAPADIEVEVDRYISSPGQALAYMVGRTEIQRIRAAAERALGDRFDIRAFHDLVLGSGSVPLGVLEAMVTGWVGEQEPAPI